MKVRIPETSEDIRFTARYKLFVEGAGDDCVDKTVLSELLEDSISIEVMGASYHHKSVAEALVYTHPHYFFLIDRDDENEQTVERSWKNFPDPAELNLLYWKRKEIENYFLLPDFICSSEHFIGKKEEYITKLEEEATKRIFMDTANFVISFLRNNLKKNWITYFQCPDNFKTKAAALKHLENLKEFKKYKSKTEQLLRIDYIKKIFERKIEEFIDKETSCIFGKGKWDHFLSGKKLLNSMIHSGLFKIKDKNDNFLQGKEKLREITKALIRKGKNLPEDFIILKKMILEKVQSE